MSRDLPGLNALQSVARRVADALGRDSLMVRGLQPAYEKVLYRLSGARGIPWTLNGIPCRIDSRQRQRIPRLYEPGVADFLAARVGPDAVCLDIGANVGAYVIQLAHWSQPAGRIYAFEPNPLAADLLARHVELNALAGRVEIVRQAVGADPGEGTLYVTGSDGRTRLDEPHPLLAGDAAPRRVSITTVDRFCDERGVRPAWMLLDIEGYEIAALAGARRTIQAHRRTLGVVVELHPSIWPATGTTRAHAERLFAELRVRPVPLAGQSDPLAEYGAVYLEAL